MTVNSCRPRTPRTRAAIAASLSLCALLALTACGKSITIGDTPEPAPDAPASSAASPAASGPSPDAAASAPGSNAGLQVVDERAEDAGRTGTGGTVVGATVQEAPAKWVQLSAVRSAQLGTHLININQATLYRFDKDSANPSRTACVDACAVTWPPVTVEEGGNVYLAGVESDKIGAIRRPDGQVQVTVGDQPVYRFSGDTKAGDTNGQGVQGTWFAVGPTGEKSAQ